MVKMNDDGMAKLQRELQGKIDKAVADGEANAASQSPEDLAASVAASMRKAGMEPNLEALTEEYRKRAAG